ncbi:hypothetical protein FRC14_007488 [Serendipita sp. 396]|nr:hypothetical protein FRC14_007488 [Serendipita sp. 396]
MTQHNILSGSDGKKRKNTQQRVLLHLQRYFPEDNFDITDISMSEYGIPLRQAPLELAIVDVDNPRGLPAGTTHPTSRIYSYTKVLASIQQAWPDAYHSFTKKDNGLPHINYPMIVTKDFILSLPSPLHKPRIALLKAYTEDYEKLRRLIWFNFMLLYCRNLLVPNSLAFAYYMLGFFMNKFNIPSYVTGSQPIVTSLSPKHKKPAKGKPKGPNDTKHGTKTAVQPVVETVTFPNDTTVRVHGTWDWSFVQEALVDTQITRQPKVDIRMEQDWVHLGYEELRLLLQFFRWSRELELGSYAITPGRGIASRYVTRSDFGNGTPSENEADLLRRGLISPDKTPEEMKTWDWMTATLVVQDPFWPAYNLASGIQPLFWKRMNHMWRGFPGSVDKGNRFLDILQPNIHPSVEPPSFPGTVLVSLFRLEERRLHRSPPASSLMRVPRSIWEGRPSKESQPDSVKTPEDLEGDLFR